jgi:hypothetical protein
MKEKLLQRDIFRNRCLSVLLIALIIATGQACQEPAGENLSFKTGVEGGNNEALTFTEQAEPSVNEVWVPVAVEKCLEKAKPPEPVEIEDRFNPYYLRANLDSSGNLELAIQVRSVAEKTTRGLLICRDGKEAYLYGPVSQSTTPMSDMRDDNFLTKRWGIISKQEAMKIVREDDGNPIGDDVRGEAIIFVFEGGGFVVYWDGKRFKGVGGV